MPKNLEEYQPDRYDKEVLSVAELYTQFPGIKEATEQMEKVLKNGEHSPEFVKEMEFALQNLRGATEILEISLKNQEEYGLVDKRWMREPEFMKNALEKGRLAMELDVRIDKDGKFWVSHATGARSSVLPPFINAMTTEEMEEKGRRFTVEEAFEIFSKYKDRGHKLILELKTLGPDEKKFPEVVESLKKLIDEKGLSEAVAVSSLSPGVLMSVHESIPEMPLILNGGIVPIVSYEKPAGKQTKTEKAVSNILRKIIPTDKKWRAFGLDLPVLGKVFEVVVSASEKTIRRPDGEGTQTGYALTRLPEDLVKVLREQRKKGMKFGGMVSLSAVTILASVLENLGATKEAEEMRRYYNEIVDDLGLGKMATTWGQGLNKIPLLGNTLFKNLKPEEQIRIFKEQLGIDVLIYTKSPEAFAHKLEPFSIYKQKIKKKKEKK